MKVIVIVERGHDGNWGAYTPDLPVAVIASSEAEANKLIREALDMYLADLREKGLPLPITASVAQEIEINV
jgi:predicted RNase H-like HicB family nuclease